MSGIESPWHDLSLSTYLDTILLPSLTYYSQCAIVTMYNVRRPRKRRNLHGHVVCSNTLGCTSSTRPKKTPLWTTVSRRVCISMIAPISPGDESSMAPSHQGIATVRSIFVSFENESSPLVAFFLSLAFLEGVDSLVPRLAV